MPEEDISSAKPQDIYVDKDGKLWRVIGVCGEPSVMVEEIEPEFTFSNLRSGAMPTKHQQRGGVSGLMWDGFKRIYRKEGQ